MKKIFIPMLPFGDFLNRKGLTGSYFNEKDKTEILWTHICARMISENAERGEKFIFVSEQKLVSMQMSEIIRSRFEGFKSKVTGGVFAYQYSQGNVRRSVFP